MLVLSLFYFPSNEDLGSLVLELLCILHPVLRPLGVGIYILVMWMHIIIIWYC